MEHALHARDVLDGPRRADEGLDLALALQPAAEVDDAEWNLHDLWPELALPDGALFSKKWTSKIALRLAGAEQTMRVRIARDELRRVREQAGPAVSARRSG